MKLSFLVHFPLFLSTLTYCAYSFFRYHFFGLFSTLVLLQHVPLMLRYIFSFRYTSRYVFNSSCFHQKLCVFRKKIFVKCIFIHYAQKKRRKKQSTKNVGGSIYYDMCARSICICIQHRRMEKEFQRFKKKKNSWIERRKCAIQKQFHHNLLCTLCRVGVDILLFSSIYIGKIDNAKKIIAAELQFQYEKRNEL